MSEHYSMETWKAARAIGFKSSSQTHWKLASKSRVWPLVKKRTEALSELALITGRLSRRQIL